MDIRLVTTSFNDEVHATFNDKKTGCGINLLKSENVTRYRRGAVMTDLGELTCEKCKTKIAKEMIRSDQKEMKLLLKEEKMRAKKGLDDVGIVPLGNTTAKPTRARSNDDLRPRQVAVKPAAKPEPEPQPAKAEIPQTIPGTGVAMDNSLAQFAINKPTEEAPAQSASQQADDFLAQFAVPTPGAEPAQAPQQAAPAPSQPAPQQDDFLSQFAIPNPAEEPAPAPAPVQTAAPPVIDDISAAITAANVNTPPPIQPAAPAPQAAPAPSISDNDLLNMFSVENPQDQQIEVIPSEQPAQAGMYDNDANVIDVAEESVSAAPVIDDISAALEAAAQNAPKPVAPVPVQPVHVQAAPEPQPVPAQAEQEASNVSEWDLIANQLFGANAPAQQPGVPGAMAEMGDLPDPENINIPPAHVAVDSAIEDITAPAVENLSIPEPPAPVLDDIANAEPAIGIAASPVQEAAPVIDDISAAMTAAAQNAPKPVAPVQPAPVQTAAPKPAAPKPAANQPIPDPSQIISVPQITGYDVANQPIYTYVQMQITGYDDNGQPVLAPIPGQEIPAFTAPFNKNTRLQDAIKAAQEVPTSSKDMTPGQRIAAAEAAKGSPISANVSKIATNPHSRSTSQAFINAISESKEYANQSLTDTQGLQQRTRVIGSIEDVLSQLGDNSLKQKKAAEAKAQANVPQFEEYKAPTRSSYSSSRPSAPRRTTSPMDDMPLTKAELKARKKQEKIDAKFKKEMAKRGF